MTIYWLLDYFQKHFGQDFDFVSWSTMKISNEKYILCPFLNMIKPGRAILFWAKFQFFQSNDLLMHLFGFKKIMVHLKYHRNHFLKKYWQKLKIYKKCNFCLKLCGRCGWKIPNVFKVLRIPYNVLSSPIDKFGIFNPQKK